MLRASAAVRAVRSPVSSGPSSSVVILTPLYPAAAEDGVDRACGAIDPDPCCAGPIRLPAWPRSAWDWRGLARPDPFWPQPNGGRRGRAGGSLGAAARSSRGAGGGAAGVGSRRPRLAGQVDGRRVLLDAR